MKDFVHLHLHSEYSLLDGALRISDIPKIALEMGQSAVALTDHGAMYGVVQFYEACKKAGIKPIVGCEVYVAPRSRFDKSYQKDHQGNHLVLLCKNEIGYQNLIRMVSLSYTEGFYTKPRVDMELLSENSEGLIALSACLAGFIPRAIAEDEYETARDYALKLRNIFGDDSFYLELQDHGIDLQRKVNAGLVRISKETGIPLVATNDVHYMKKSDAENQAILTCINTNSCISDGRPIGFETDEFYFKSSDEMVELFGNYEGAIENTVKIAEMCNFDFDFGKLILPKFDCPAGKSGAEMLRTLAIEGFERRRANGDILQDGRFFEETYKKRMEHELEIIIRMGYAEYFLITQDFVSYAKSKNIPVGPGRGSGAGSLVSYFIGITDVDPVRYDLMFERFLNPERISMPDFDIDFCYDRRSEVIRYVSERYGRDHVCQIITFGTLAARAVVRDVGRALGLSYAEVDSVAKLIPRALGITLADALRQSRELKDMYDDNPNVRKLLDIASSLEGLPRHTSTHAAGVVIADRPVCEYVPLAMSGDVQVTQFDMDTVAKLGLLKFDFLGLRYLTIISDTEKKVCLDDAEFDITKIPMDDKKTFDLISDGRTLGVFQLESAGMRRVLLQMRPDDIECIVAAISLYRPGPMDSIPKYLENRNDPSKISYKSEKLRDILSLTNGCIVYQEQVMQICRTLAGYSLGRADIIRRMMAKKKTLEMEKERQIFVDGMVDGDGNVTVPGAVRCGVERDAALSVFDEMADFAKYAFNKSHAVSYAIVAYRTAYLKTHYPAQYFASLLTSVLDNEKKLAEYAADAEKMGISILPPSINSSDWNFGVCRDKRGKAQIRFGLLGIKNVGRNFIDAIVRERKAGVFTSFEDFISRMAKSDINKRQIEGLIKSGAFDEFGVYRSRLYVSFEKIIENVSRKEHGNISGQLDMFSVMEVSDGSAGRKFEYPSIPDFSIREKLKMEKESTGLYFLGNVLDDYSRDIEDRSPVSVLTLLSESDSDCDGHGATFFDGQAVCVCGVVGKRTEKVTRSGKKMLFFILEDHYSQIEVLVFSSDFAKYGGVLASENAVCINGTLSMREEEEPKIVLKSAELLLENSSYVPRRKAPEYREAPKSIPQKTDGAPKTLYLRVPDMSGEPFLKAMNLIEIFSGECPVIFFDQSSGKYIKAGGVGAGVTDFVIRQLRCVLGENNVIPK